MLQLPHIALSKLLRVYQLLIAEPFLFLVTILRFIGKIYVDSIQVICFDYGTRRFKMNVKESIRILH